MLQFVYDAYQAGAGIDIGVAPSAVDWWNAHPDEQHPATPTHRPAPWSSGNPRPTTRTATSRSPRAVTFVISSEERASTTIHEFPIADRNAAGYPELGWIQPA